MTCPGCGRLVSHMTTYIFVPKENLRWHPECYRAQQSKEETND